MTNLGKNLKKRENFSLTISEKAKKDMRKLPVAEIKKLDAKIKILPKNPYVKGSRKLTGSKRTYRLRQGDYRILYEIEGQEIIVMSVGNRREIYR